MDSAGKVYFTENYYDPYLSYGTYSQRLRVLTPSSNYKPPAPTIAPGGVQNSASFAPAPVAPGSIATIYGGFGLYSPVQASGTPLPTALTGLSIQSQSGMSAPLFYASAGVVNIQVPWELAGQSSVSFRAVLNGNGGPSQTLLLAPLAPGIFTAISSGQGAIADSSGQLVGSQNPARAGSAIQEIYCTGLGACNKSSGLLGARRRAPVHLQPSPSSTVKIGGIAAAVTFSGLSPGTVGESPGQRAGPPRCDSGTCCTSSPFNRVRYFKYRHHCGAIVEGAA